MIRLERETPLPHMPTRDREGLGQEEASREARDSQGEQQLQPGGEVEEGFIDAWYWRRCFENSRTLYHFVPRTVLKYHLHCFLVLLESPLYEWGN